MQRNYGWLEIAEYLSIAASAIGAVAAVTIQKTVLMAAPMSISLMLNLLHRQKLLSLSRQIIRAEVAEQCQELSQLFATLPSSFLTEIPRDKPQIKPEIRGSFSVSADFKGNPLGEIAPNSPWDLTHLQEMETSLERLCQKFEYQQIQISNLIANLEAMNEQITVKLTGNFNHFSRHFY